MSDERAAAGAAEAAGERGGPGGSRLRVRTVEILPGEVVLIDQLALPQQERYVTCRSWREVAERISDMTVRGAPAIGVTAAGGIALAAAEAAAANADDPATFRAALEQAASGLLATRPTAVNLRWALDEMRRAWEAGLAAGGPAAAPAAVAAMLLREGAGHPRRRHRPLPAHRRARRRSIRPSSRTCSSTLNTSGWAFSTSSSSTTE